MKISSETIAAIATAPGRGGIGIIRISGTKTQAIAKAIIGHVPTPRYANYVNFINSEDQILDQGIALYFPNPNSFTGEDVLELQGHGGPVILDCLLQRCIELGARLARPGEFSERAFLNDKLDLAQAEAIADLINAESVQAAQAALRSLKGEFSKKIHDLVERLIYLRTYVEATIDFAEEEIDFLSESNIKGTLTQLLNDIKIIQATARQGALLREGMNVVIAGRPNAGKSSLLNALSGRDSAIVTAIPGTTRDVLREAIQIDGMPLHIIDTAGLRESTDQVEQEGIRRALAEIKQADQILLVIDSTTMPVVNIDQLCKEFWHDNTFKSRLTIIRNKIDQLNEKSVTTKQNNVTIISLSAKEKIGIDLLKNHLKSCMGFNTNLVGSFSARRRHLAAIAQAEEALIKGQEQLEVLKVGEILAEELRQAQHALSEITGEFTTEDLLGRIFSSFCIGK